MKSQKNMENIVLALSSALTNCILLLQGYSILALKIMQDRLQLSCITLEAVFQETLPLLCTKEWRLGKLTFLVDIYN